MPVILPFRPSLEAYQFRSILLETEYAFRVRWNRREQAFYFDVRETTGEAIALGLRLVLGAYMGRVSTHRLFRRGALVCRIPQGDDRREPQFDDAGVRVQVFYFTTAELVAEILSRLSSGQGAT